MKRSPAALFQIDVDDLRDHLGALRRRQTTADDLADRGRCPGCRRADLVPLLAVLVDAEDADVADVVVAAGVHAAGDVERNVADVVRGSRGRRNAPGWRWRSGSTWRWPGAEVAAGAADDVGQQADVGRRQAGGAPRSARARRGRTACARRRARRSARGWRAVRRSCRRSARSATSSICSSVMSPGARRVFQRQDHARVTGDLVASTLRLAQAAKALSVGARWLASRRRCGVSWRRGEVAGDAGELGVGDGVRAVLAEYGPFFLDLAGELVDAERLDEDLMRAL